MQNHVVKDDIKLKHPLPGPLTKDPLCILYSSHKTVYWSVIRNTILTKQTAKNIAAILTSVDLLNNVEIQCSDNLKTGFLL